MAKDRDRGEFSRFADGYVGILNKVSSSYDLVASRLGTGELTGGGGGSCSSCLPPDKGMATGCWVKSAEKGDAHLDCSCMDEVLNYVSDLLMKEDVEEKACLCREQPSALEAAEKSLYEAIGEKYPPSSGYTCSSNLVNAVEESSSSCSVSSGSANRTDAFSGRSRDPNPHVIQDGESDMGLSSSSVLFWDGMTSYEEQIDSNRTSSSWDPTGILSSNSICFQGDPDEFFPLPVDDFLDSRTGGWISVSEEQTKYTGDSVRRDISRGKKNPLVGEVNSDERVRKQMANYCESVERSEMFDRVLLQDKESEAALRESLRNLMLTSQGKDSTVERRGRGKKNRHKRDVVDLRTLLTLCARAVSTDDRRTASDLLKQIRQHTSPTGDGMQRLGHYFADGLEARLAGFGTEIYNALIVMPPPVVDTLKAYHLYLATCPFRKLLNYFSNMTIVNLAEKAEKVHIIDFGGTYGFQWPSLIQRLSSRTSGPPKLRLTLIDFPLPGLRPAERLEGTGRRLRSYAETFHVPFECDFIAAKWDSIKIEDIRKDTGAVTIVNCVYRLEDLLDESVIEQNPRDTVLNLILKISPDVFIQGVVNGDYGAPFFISRFREALFHFSAFFDLLDTTVPRDNPERMLLERELLGRRAMNAIACEGSERIERPETYKKWHSRNLRAGFLPLPLNLDMLNLAKDRLHHFYHKDFEIEEDGQWLLQGWKGRIVHALSTWRPASSRSRHG
ncbi:hypothetical protein MLD38_011153 [Melastoma candidum]|uniref:Uncharacterized protein n=1 Tax=Melastoma candidum TaxID=119954 RepID=A0ACB9R3G4_9MYRT|nr:hypothetical protein MLD38_011153 [Melastoma candidum]